MNFDEYWQSFLKDAKSLPSFQNSQTIAPLLKEVCRCGWNQALLSAAKLTLDSAPELGNKILQLNSNPE